MNWFVVKIVFQIISEDQNFPQFDEQLRLIDAINQELALEMAHQLGLMQRDEVVINQNGKLIWKFIAVTEINHLGEISHGTEINYKINEPSNPSNYISLALTKAEGLKNKKKVC
jgi:hypothetical protein